MNRYNIFYGIHKGLRAMLYETAIQIQQTDFVNQEEAEQALEQIKNLVELFDKHADSEDRFVFAAVQPYEPAVVEAFEREHVQDHALAENLSNMLTTFTNASVDDEKIWAGKLVYQAINEFMIFNLKHMAKEEDIINKILWRNYSDEQLKGITGNIIANIQPEEMAQFSRWTMRWLSNYEIAEWLKEEKNTAPDFACESLMQTANQELNANRLQLIQEAITEGALVE